MGSDFTPAARRVGPWSASPTVVPGIACAGTLILGFLSLESSRQPIRDPMFTILEAPAMVPAMISLMVAGHAGVFLAVAGLLAVPLRRELPPAA